MIEIQDMLSKCKDSNSKMYIDEAIKCYNANAYRACINYTWLAVFTNILYKVKQLSELDNANAKSMIDNFETIVKENNITNFLKFEREILEEIPKNFKFIDAITLIDLKRLQEDRNRCSHPSFYKSSDEVYQPSAYLARHYLMVSIDKLISENNIYGKEIIDVIINEISNPYFPIDYIKIQNILQKNYLARTDDNIIINLAKVLVKKILDDELDNRQILVYQETLRFLISQYMRVFEQSMFVNIDDIINKNQVRYKNIHKILSIDKVIWNFLSEGTKDMIKNYINQMKSDDIECLNYYSSISDLSEVVLQKVDEFKHSKNLQLVSFQNATDNLKQDIIDKYLNSGSFDTANSLANSIVEILQGFDKERISEFLVKAYQNSQITASHEFKRTLLPNLKDKFSDDELRELEKQAREELRKDNDF